MLICKTGDSNTSLIELLCGPSEFINISTIGDILTVVPCLDALQVAGLELFKKEINIRFLPESSLLQNHHYSPHDYYYYYSLDSLLPLAVLLVNTFPPKNFSHSTHLH